METVLEYLSVKLKNTILNYIAINKIKNVEEIRLRAERAVNIKVENKNLIINYKISMQELLDTFHKICEHSIYTYQKEIGEGFITIRGGHRVGISGNCVCDENGKIVNINYVSSLNFRIAREKKDCSESIIKYIITGENISNTLLVSKPGAGKTTMLRDIIRKLSFAGKTCGVIDERSEIASMYRGVPQNDIGVLSDVMSNCTKSQGMKMLVRSMAPDVIICDEIGSKEDIEAINYAMCSGVKGIFTAHGDSFDEIRLNSQINELIEKYIVETIIFLDGENKGKIKEIYKLNKMYFKI